MRGKLTFAARELIGSFADLGILLPLTIGLIACNGIKAGPALALLGIAYILTGAYYRLPVPIQPLKATAMIAIAGAVSPVEIRAAAYWMAGILLVLGLTRLADRLNDVFPRLLIQALQLNLGVMMIRTGAKFVLSYPAAIGSIALRVHLITNAVRPDRLIPSGADFWGALILLVLPQIPLTIGNAMLATNDCALKYFGPKAARVTPSRLATTMGIGNLAAAVGGGIPICHGAGGLTAHYRLGARTGYACGIIGALLLAAGLWNGPSVTAMLAVTPAWILGILLIYVGVRHGMLAGSAFRSLASAVVVLSSGIVGWFYTNPLAALGLAFAVMLLVQRMAPRASLSSRTPACK